MPCFRAPESFPCEALFPDAAGQALVSVGKLAQHRIQLIDDLCPVSIFFLLLLQKGSLRTVPEIRLVQLDVSRQRPVIVDELLDRPVAVLQAQLLEK